MGAIGELARRVLAAAGHNIEITQNDSGGMTAFVFDAAGDQVDDAYADIHMGAPGDFRGEGYFGGAEPVSEGRGRVAVLTAVELPGGIRGQGLGRRMVEALTAWAFGRGAKAVYVHSVRFPKDPDPAPFYRRLGFRDVGEDGAGNPCMKLTRGGRRKEVPDPGQKTFLAGFKRPRGGLPSAASPPGALRGRRAGHDPAYGSAREQLAHELFDWHGGPTSGLHAVGEAWLRGADAPPGEVDRALSELQRLLDDEVPAPGERRHVAGLRARLEAERGNPKTAGAMKRALEALSEEMGFGGAINDEVVAEGQRRLSGGLPPFGAAPARGTAIEQAETGAEFQGVERP